MNGGLLLTNGLSHYEGWKQRENQGHGTVVSVETLWWKKANIVEDQ